MRMTHEFSKIPVHFNDTQLTDDIPFEIPPEGGELKLGSHFHYVVHIHKMYEMCNDCEAKFTF